MPTIDEMRARFEESQKKTDETMPAIINDVGKAITDINVSDVKMRLDENKSASEQVKDIVDITATIAAVQDKQTSNTLKDAKSEELIEEGRAKKSAAEAGRIHSETDVQKEKREMYEEVLELFGIDKHLPNWLMKIVVVMLTPFYIILLLAIGVPTGIVKFLIDGVDKIFVRYDEVGKERKPQVKVITWILLAIIICGTVALTTLKCLNII